MISSVASQPIKWAGQSPGPKVLGAPSNFADLKKAHKTTSTIMTCMKAVFHDIFSKTLFGVNAINI